MWASFFVELGGQKRFAWLGGSSVLMNEAQGNLKSQKNTSGTLPVSSKVGGYRGISTGGNGMYGGKMAGFKADDDRGYVVRGISTGGNGQ